VRDTILYIIRTARASTFPLANMQIKVGEECGELAEAVNHHEGFSRHKVMKEPLAGEVADVINTVIGVLVRAYPEHTDDQLADFLESQLILKTRKWESIRADIR